MTSIADKLGLGPTRQETPLADGAVLITVTPPNWTSFRSHQVTLTADQHARYRRWRDGACFIQDALPDLTDDEREILMSGIGPDDWHALGLDDEDESP